MRTELRIVTVADVMDMPSETQDFVAASDLVIELRYDGVRAGLVGFIPGQGAYLWMHKLPLAMDHRVSFARYAKKIIECYKSKYHTIRGHSDIRSRKWLRFLGAEVKPIGGDLVEFVIHG